MSLIIIVWYPPIEFIARVSGPSVKLSLSKVTETVALPLASTGTKPLKVPPNISAALIPDRVYGYKSPSLDASVNNMNVATEPSSTEALFRACK